MLKGIVKVILSEPGIYDQVHHRKFCVLFSSKNKLTSTPGR